MRNPLIAPWTGPYGGLPPWDDLKPEHFPGALQAAIDEQHDEVEALVNNPAPPTFDNTLAALERTGRLRDRVERLFAVARENVSDRDIQALEREWQPKLTAASDAIYMNAALFQRINAVHRALPTAGLDGEQTQLVKRVHDIFVQRGAQLEPEQQRRLSEINQELASLFADFRQKVLADEDAWTPLEGASELAGLPASLVDTMRAAADARHLTCAGIVLNTRSTVDPFLTFSSRRDLRETVWRRFKNRGDNDDANDTKKTIVRIVRLRGERAALLGYASHAQLHMKFSMAKEPSAAQAFMTRVWPAAVSSVRADVAAMKAIAAREDPSLTIEPWDYLYYAEKLRQQRFDLDQSALKPYFVLDNMVDAALWSAGQMFELSFREITGQVPVFHPEVRVWEINDRPAGALRGVFYLDNFARSGKKSGAWAFAYREQEQVDMLVVPVMSNNNNFVKGSPNEPVLISFDDVRTLFHEFGHALHGLLQEIRYPSLAETPRDFVEYPSQLNENWALTREVLDRFARHCQTGEPIPPALIDGIQRARQFNQGYATVEYLADAMLDMDLHTRSEQEFDPDRFERETLERIGMPREIALRHRLPHFDHLFGSDAYASGYYSYIWADVMAADTWKAFLESGGAWDKPLAQRYRQNILSEGNATDRADAYRRFLGRDPDPNALFEQRGFPITSGTS